MSTASTPMKIFVARLSPNIFLLHYLDDSDQPRQILFGVAPVDLNPPPFRQHQSEAIRSLLVESGMLALQLDLYQLLPRRGDLLLLSPPLPMIIERRKREALLFTIL